jgi:hypothetical protein
MHFFNSIFGALFRGAVCALILSFFIQNARSDDSVRTVALSTSFGPPNAVQFLAPSIDASGDIAFSSSRGGGAFTDNWVSTTSGIRHVGGMGDQAPGTASGVIFNTMSVIPRISNSGRATLIGELVGPGVSSTNRNGLWSDDTSGNLTLVARTGDPAAGFGPGIVYDFVGSNLLNALGHSVFGETVRGPGIDSTNNRATWFSDGSGSIQLVSHSGAAAINDHDQVLTGSVAAISSWTPGGGTVLIVSQGQAVPPGTPGTASFGALQFPALNNAGDIAFFDNASGGRHWVRNPNGTYRLAARIGVHAPGTPAGINFSALNESFQLNSAGHIATWARVAGPGVDSTNNEGIWAEQFGGLNLVARVGDLAPGTPAGVQFTDLNQLSLNAAGQVAFTGTVGGPGITQFNDRGIWAQQPDGTLKLIVREGDVIDVDNGPTVDLRTVAVLDAQNFFFESGNEDGRASMFNDSSQLVFAASFFDNSSGVFVSNLAAVPEPATLLLVTSAATVVLCGRSRRFSVQLI